jgi:hypothetical protein
LDKCEPGMISGLITEARHKLTDLIDCVGGPGAMVSRTQHTGQSGLTSHLPSFGFAVPRFMVIHIISMSLIHLRHPLHMFLTANNKPSSACAVRVHDLRRFYAVVLASNGFSCICTSKLVGRLGKNRMVSWYSDHSCTFVISMKEI